MSANLETSTSIAARLPRIEVENGTLEALKWLGLLLMTADHVNKYLFAERLPYVFASARIVMPLFGFVMAYNLARPRALERAVFARTLKRLAFFAAVASPFFLALNGLWPLNVLWMLFLSASICYCILRGGPRFRALAVALFLVGAALVEFWWFGVLFVVGAWLYCREPSVRALTVWVFGAISLTIANQTWHALLAVPFILAAPYIRLSVPRLRWVFYAYYPAHLALLMVIAYTWRM